MRTVSGRTDRIHALAPALLLGLAAAALLLRIPSIVQPLGIDQSLWASAVRGMERGQKLYADVWEQRPPGIYLTYWAGFALFGWSAAAVAWLDIIAATVTTFALYRVGKILADRLTGALASALFATMTMPAWMTGNGGFLERSICETFIAMCVGLAALCGASFRSTRASVALAAAGLFLGAAVVYKPNAALYFPAILAWTLWPVPRGPADSRGRLTQVVVAVSGAAIVPVLTLIWLWRVDVLADAKIAVIDFNRFYVSQGFDLTQFPRFFGEKVFLRFKTEPLWLAGVLGSLVMVWEIARRRPLSPLAWLALAWGGAAVIVIAVNGMRPFNTYWMQAPAPLAIAAAWWLLTWWSATRLKRLAVAGVVAASALLLVQRSYVARVFGDFASNARELIGRDDHTAFLDRFGGYGNSRGYSARAHEELATYVRAHTGDTDKIFLFGINGAGIYFHADRLPAHRFLRVNFFVPAEFPDPRFTLAAVVDDLRRRRPVYLIFEQLHSGSDMGKAVDALPENPLVHALLESYTFETRIEDFSLYRSK